MAADSPWIKWWTDDFLTGILDLAADEIGVYTVLLNLMASRGGPIPDDRRWLARRCGTTTRRFNQIIDHLTGLGKLQHREGLIGNRRMIEELEARRGKSARARSSAMARWHADQDELPLETGTDPRTREHTRTARAPESDENSRKSGRKSEDKNEIKSEPKSHNSRNSAKTAHANASGLAGARVRSSEDSEEDSSSHLSDSKPRTSLKAMYDRICEAAGFEPRQPEQIDRAMNHVERWRDAGYDLDDIILPAIRADVIESDHPTRTLGRFNKRIKHRAAQRAAKPKAAASKPAAPPVLEPDGEDPMFQPLRLALLDQCGDRTYATTFNDIRFADPGPSGGHHPLRLNGPEHRLDQLRHGRWKPILLRHASSLGFTEIW